mmetsp:Transcript_3868/g.5593  ORF Transcript_3868/g.5593 Transcript_3868/m.5593 type:complete len:80 (+) Transcript_3868:1513-1752(+)
MLPTTVPTTLHSSVSSAIPTRSSLDTPINITFEYFENGDSGSLLSSKGDIKDVKSFSDVKFEKGSPDRKAEKDRLYATY